MGIVKFFRLIINILIFIVLIVLIIDNIQIVSFNLFGIYFTKISLIALCLIFFALGVIVGLFNTLIKIIKLRAMIHKLEKQLNEKTN